MPVMLDKLLWESGDYSGCGMLGLCGSPGLIISVDKWSRTKSIKEDMLKAVIEEGVVSC